MTPESQRDALQHQVSYLLRLVHQCEQRLQLIGYEIHDGLMQDLAAAIMFLDAGRKDVTYSRPEGLQNADRGLQLVRDALAEARRLVITLDSPTPQVASLSTALGALADRLSADHGLQIDFVQPLVEPQLSSAARSTLLRVIREALTNVWKHSQSQRVELTLRERDGQLLATVRDWGVGFDPLQVEQGHFGLQGIRQRAALLGGTASITSSPGQGTTVEISLPLEKIDA